MYQIPIVMTARRNIYDEARRRDQEPVRVPEKENDLAQAARYLAEKLAAVSHDAFAGRLLHHVSLRPHGGHSDRLPEIQPVQTGAEHLGRHG